MARILLGVSGGIAAYKALEFIRLATAAGHVLRVVQTPRSQRFVGEASFAALSGAPVLTDEFESDPLRGAFPDQQPPTHQPLSHLQLLLNADLYLVAPASANTLAKLANGMADNLLTSCALAANCPIVVAPAMNNRMYEHPATQSNIELLRERGVHIVEPGIGRLASLGEQGVGRLADPDFLLEQCERALSSVPASACDWVHTSARDWQGLRVLITAGGTREPIDSVRFVGNSSSGRMGFALADAAHLRGAQVTLLAANVALPEPVGVKLTRVSTAAQLEQACEREFGDCDVLLMAAAVADFRPQAPVEDKIKKGGAQRLTIELEPTADILCGLSSRRTEDQTLVAFAAEHGPAGLEHARTKLHAKGVDVVVFNDISRPDIGFESDRNEVTIITANGDQHVPSAPKQQIADAILDAVERLRNDARCD